MDLVKVKYSVILDVELNAATGGGEMNLSTRKE